MRLGHTGGRWGVAVLAARVNAVYGVRMLVTILRTAFLALAIAAGWVLLFVVGDRKKTTSQIDKRRDAYFAVGRGAAGFGVGIALWLTTDQGLWLLIPLTVWPVSLYLVVSGLADLVLVHTRDRELLRQERAAIRQDQQIRELAREAGKSRELMRRSGMTDDEIQQVMEQRLDQAKRKMEEILAGLEPGRDTPERAASDTTAGPLGSDTVASANSFSRCWHAAGSHLNQIGKPLAMEWRRTKLEHPYSEHLAFRLGNQLFFVFVRDADGQVEGPGSIEQLLAVADGCNGWACLMPMRFGEGNWRPERSGWGLIHARNGSEIDPPSRVTNELIEMNDWEVHDYAVLVVRDDLVRRGHSIVSLDSRPGIEPSIWFDDDQGQRAWVVVRAVRFPELFAHVPHYWHRIAADTAEISDVGYFASVAVAGGEERQGEAADIRLLRGRPIYARYTGLEVPTEDDIAASEEDFIGRGRLASRYRKRPPR